MLHGRNCESNCSKILPWLSKINENFRGTLLCTNFSMLPTQTPGTISGNFCEPVGQNLMPTLNFIKSYALLNVRNQMDLH